MSDRAQNRILLIIAIVTAAITILIQIGSVGELKGKIETVIEMHEKRLTKLEEHQNEASKEISEIRGRIHGMAANVEKQPAKVIKN